MHLDCFFPLKMFKNDIGNYAFGLTIFPSTVCVLLFLFLDVFFFFLNHGCIWNVPSQ